MRRSAVADHRFIVCSMGFNLTAENQYSEIHTSLRDVVLSTVMCGGTGQVEGFPRSIGGPFFGANSCLTESMDCRLV